MGGIKPVGNAEAFPGASFGWLCPRPVSLLADQNVQLSALLNTVSLLLLKMVVLVLQSKISIR